MILGLAVLQVVRKKCDSLKSTPAPEDWTFESSDMEDLRGIGFNPSKDEWKEVKADAKKMASEINVETKDNIWNNFPNA
jgi:hypothetical protein